MTGLILLYFFPLGILLGVGFIEIKAFLKEKIVRDYFRFSRKATNLDLIKKVLFWLFVSLTPIVNAVVVAAGVVMFTGEWIWEHGLKDFLNKEL